MYQLAKWPASVLRVISGLWIRRWLLLSVAFAFAVIGWLLVWAAPPHYEASVEIASGIDAQRRADFEKAAADPAWIIAKTGLSKDEIRGLRIRADGVGGLRAAVIDQHEDGARQRAGAIADALRIILVAEGVVDGSARLPAIERQRINLETELTEREDAINRYREIHWQDVALQSSLERRRTAAEDDYTAKRDEILQLRERILTIEGLLPAAPRQPFAIDLSRLRAERAGLAVTYFDSLPDIRVIDAKITALRNGPEINPEFTRLQTDLKNARDRLAAAEKDLVPLQQALSEFDRKAAGAPLAPPALIALQRPYEAARRAYESLLSYRDHVVREYGFFVGRQDMDVVMARTVSYFGLSREWMSVMVLLCALLFSGLVGLFLSIRDQSISIADDLASYDLPVIGSVGRHFGSDQRKEAAQWT